MSDGFVGRPAELDTLHQCAAGARDGHPQLVFVEGAPGIGKTSLVAQFATSLSTWRRIVVAGYEDEKRLPFGLLSRLMVAGRSPGTAANSPAEPIMNDPIAIGAELLQLLGDLEQAGPVAVVIDDAPWADPQSLLALTFAVRRLQAERVLVVLTMRSENVNQLPPGLLHYGQDVATDIRLSGLTTDEVCELFGQQVRGQLPRRAAERLQKHTAGHPLHLRALFQELPVGELRRIRGPLPAPTSYANLVVATLAGCAEPTRRLVMAAAVLGMQSSLVQAALVADVANSLQGLEAAARTDLVDAREDRDGWMIAFRHPLIRSAVYDDLGPASRSRLHGRAAAVQQQKALFHRAAAAGDRVDPMLVAELVAQASTAESSARLSAAADLLLTARRLSPAGTAKDELLLDAIDLLLRAGELAEAAVFAERLAAMPDTVKRTLVQAGWAAMEGRHDQVDALARTVWSEGDDAQRASAAALLAQLAVLRNDNAGAIRWAQEVERTGTLTGSMATEIKCVHAIALALSGELTAGLRIVDESFADDAPPELLATSGTLRMVAGDAVGARRDLQRCVPGHPGWAPAHGCSPDWPRSLMPSTAAGPGRIRDAMQIRLFRWSTTPTRRG